MRTKEKLRGEIEDWVKRSQHESKLAFECGDLWAGLVAGARVYELTTIEEERRKLPYENGADVENLWQMVEGVTKNEDYGGRIRRMVDQSMHPMHVVGIDQALPGSDMSFLFVTFKKSLDEVSDRLRQQIQGTYRAVPGMYLETPLEVSGTGSAQKIMDEVRREFGQKQPK